MIWLRASKNRSTFDQWSKLFFRVNAELEIQILNGKPYTIRVPL